jgi:glutathione synthase/RimK-type ligase-like ATP-grasp enzyme
VGKLGYLVNRIKNMSYKRLFDTVNDVHKETGKNKVSIFLDIVHCGLKYQAGYMDYKLFEFYNLNSKQRKTIITRGINNSIVKKYNDKKYYYIFDNKVAFNKRFNKYLQRDWLEITNTEENFNEFKEFIKKHPEIVIKPVDGTCGKGIEKIKVSEKNARKTYDDLIETNRCLVEEVAVQCKELSKLHPSSINTIRMVTLRNELVAAYLRIGNKGHVVDNFNSEGLVAPINIETGIIDYPAIAKAGGTFEKHPMTNEDIIWFQIPKWPRVKRYIEKASKEVPQIQYIGWDVCLGENGPFLIEGNPFPGHDIYQLPAHRTNGMGMLPRFKEVMNRKEEKVDETSNSN